MWEINESLWRVSVSNNLKNNSCLLQLDLIFIVWPSLQKSPTTRNTSSQNAQYSGLNHDNKIQVVMKRNDPLIGDSTLNVPQRKRFEHCRLVESTTRWQHRLDLQPGWNHRVSVVSCFSLNVFSFLSCHKGT